MAVLEISDLVAEWDSLTGERLPVRRAEVVARLRAARNARAARIVRRMPVTGEFLDPVAVDRLLVRVHTELQRLNEELHMAQRFAELLVPMLTAVRASGTRPRVVDIGCGLGFLVRSMAASGVLGADVELVGVDFNRALVAEATRLAEDERLPCTFVCADAFALAEEATVYLSSGLLHHFPADKLPEFSAPRTAPAHRRSSTTTSPRPGWLRWAPGCFTGPGCGSRSAGTTASHPRCALTATRCCCPPRPTPPGWIRSCSNRSGTPTRSARR